MVVSTKTLVGTSLFNPYEHRDQGSAGTTTFQTLIHLVKGAIGTGILAMPMAFTHSGWIIGLIVTMVIACLCCYGILVLVRCQYMLCKRNEIGFMTYPQVMKEALISGPSCMGCLVPLAVPFVDTFLLLYQIGICSVYVIFMGKNVHQVLEHYYEWKLDVRIYELFFFIPCLTIMFVRNLRMLTPFSLVANILTFVGLGIILYYCFDGMPPIKTADKTQDITKLPSFIGTVLFALEAVGVILAVHAKMKHPKSFVGYFGTLSQSLLIAGSLYAFVGLAGYLKFRDKSEGSITLNLPEEVLANVVKLAYTFAVFISFGLQGYVPFDILWNNYIIPNYTDMKRPFLWESLLRISIVLVSFSLALAIPDLGIFIELLGAFCLSMLGFTFPALIEICVLHPDQHGACYYMLIKNVVLAIFGIAVMVFGVFNAIQDMIDAF